MTADSMQNCTNQMIHPPTSTHHVNSMTTYHFFFSLPPSFACRNFCLLILCEIRCRAGRFLPGGDVTNPMRGMNSSFVDSTDYQSLQGFPTMTNNMNQSFSSIGFNNSYGYDAFSRFGDVLSCSVTMCFCYLPPKTYHPPCHPQRETRLKGCRIPATDSEEVPVAA